VALSSSEVSRLAYLFISTLRSVGGLNSVGIIDSGGFLEQVLLKNRIKAQTDFMSQGDFEYDLKEVSTLLVYDSTTHEMSVADLAGMFKDAMIITCFNRQLGYEEWRKALCDIGKVTTIYRCDDYQMMVVLK
jgi:hypothetical protein